MNLYRRMVVAAATCTAGLSLAACSAGITTTTGDNPPAAAHAGSPVTPAAHSSHTPSPKPSPSSNPVSTVRANARITAFPAPAGAQVLINESCEKAIFMFLGPVTPSAASAFYSTALPRAGYQVTENALTSDPTTGAPNGMAELSFTGHGYTGIIMVMRDLKSDSSSAASLSGSIPSGMLSKDVEEVGMNLHGVPDSYNCPGT